MPNSHAVITNFYDSAKWSKIELQTYNDSKSISVKKAIILDSLIRVSLVLKSLELVMKCCQQCVIVW